MHPIYRKFEDIVLTLKILGPIIRAASIGEAMAR